MRVMSLILFLQLPDGFFIFCAAPLRSIDAAAAPDDVARDVVSAINGLVAPSLPKPRMRSPTSVADLVDNDSDV